MERIRPERKHRLATRFHVNPLELAQTGTADSREKSLCLITQFPQEQMTPCHISKDVVYPNN